MNPETTATLAQFGAAGMIALMWLTERRAAAVRERQLSEAHERLMQDRRSFDLLLGAMQENTRALTGIELGQRTLSSVLERVAAGSHGPERGPA